MLCTKLDTESDQQAMVVGRLLTTLGDDQHAIVKLFLVQMLEKSSEVQMELHLCFEIFKFRTCLINILQLQGVLSPRPEALGTVEDDLGMDICIGSQSRASNDCRTHHPEVSK